MQIASVHTITSYLELHLVSLSWKEISKMLGKKNMT